MNIKVPYNVKKIISKIKNCGFDAYIVGGCVRDSILGRVPNDWDICTSAKPQEIIDIFSSEYSVIETGLKHGTVTVLIDKEPYEITTYRIDGEYKDNRRPEFVEFTENINEDLSRRDFTINAMAYNDESGLIDVFKGEDDCKYEIIRCVGEAEKRFDEDALRILRAMRFSSQLDFKIDKDTKNAIFKLKELLNNISAERINMELCKTILGKNVINVFREYRDIFAVIIPEIKSMFDFEQYNYHHIYDVWEHTLKTIENTPNDLIVRFTMFFHDIGKPLCFEKDSNGVGHFYGHAKKSTDIARNILERLRFDNDTIKNVTELIYYHDANILNGDKYIKRWLCKIGEQQFRRLLEVKKSDTMGLNPKYIDERITEFNCILDRLEKILESEQCFDLKSLKINGRDLISIGVPQGTAIGDILRKLLQGVIDGEIENEHEILLETAKKLI